MENLRPNEQRGKYAIAMIWIIMILNIVSLVTESAELLISHEIISTHNITNEILIVLISILSYTTLLLFVAAIISIITFISWFRRAYYNIGIKTGRLDYNDGWAAGAWFIPYMNLYVPYRIMKELYIKTDRYLLENSEDLYSERLKLDYVKGWWTIWIISIIINYISFKIVWKDIAIDTLGEGNPFLRVLSYVIQVTLCIITIIIIEDYQKAEKILCSLPQDTQPVEEAKSDI